MKSRTARSPLVWAGLVVTAGFGYLAVRNAHPGELWRGIREADLGLLAACLAVLAVSIFMRGLRWRALFPGPSRPTVKAITHANLVGYLFNTILPARAGEAARVIALRRAGWSAAQTTGTVVVERVYDVLSLLVLLFIVAPWLPHVSWLRTAVILAAALAAGLLAVIVMLAVYRERALRVLLKPVALLPFVSTEQFDRGTRNLGTGLAGILNLRIAVAAWAWTIASWAVMTLSYWIGLRALDIHLSPLAGLLVVIALGLSMILPSSPGALGVFEAAAVVALKAYGVEGTEALSYALAVHAVNLALYLGAGFVALRFGAGREQRRGWTVRRAATRLGVWN